MVRRATLFAGLLLSIQTVGCADGSKRYGVSGTVTLRGEPLPDGVVTFVPQAADGPTQGSGVVERGAFRIPADHGLAPGKYRVSITSPDGRTPQADPNAAPGPSGNFTSKDRVPPEFNIRSTLEVEVKPDTKANVYEFKVP